MSEKLSIVSTENDTSVSMNNAFEKNARPLIDLVDDLREFGLENDVSLPSIVVIGDQSSGKSSVLEAISGIQLPRGTGIMTRCPLELKLKHSTKWSAKILYVTLRNERIEKGIESPNLISAEIMNAQNIMTKSKVQVSEKLISLFVSSPDNPDLSIIDLPGIARVPMPSQSKDTCKRIKNIISEYARQENTIMLCVIPSNQDVATIESLNIAKDMDPEGKRTLGVLTKPDLIDKGAENDVLNLIKNKTYHLEKGYSLVKCRSQLDIDNDLTVSESRKRENDFFLSSNAFRALYKNGIAGINSLIEKLSKELVTHIKANIPNMRHQLQTEVNNAQWKLKELGKAPPQADSDRQLLLISIGTGIAQDFEKLTKAEYWNRLPEDHRLYSIFYKKLLKLKEVIEKHQRSPTDQEFLKKIKFELESQKGVELPGFPPFNVCKYFISGFLDDIENDVFSTITDISSHTLETTSYIVETQVLKYQELKNAYLAEVRNLHSQMVQNCVDAVKGILQQEYFPFSVNEAYNKIFNVENSDLELAARNDEAKIFCQKHVHREEEGTINPFKRQRTDNPVCEPLHCMKCLKINGSDIKTRDKMMAVNISSYIAVSSSRLMDNIAMTIIFHLFSQYSKQLLISLAKFASVSSNCQLIAEDCSLANERNSLKCKIERLEKGLKRMLNF